ncbi:hypothetical protein BLNAU_12128 [Blattamonas nauphoetae]|uniref:Uncharacterized protein n=1 Tax=Blattamonas nauphoetae TaxID=2049346 RepID=A0ABQ9XNJ3_9EUKA|nr:hypothetical protein BLNAU_12128 [Blattamonas nauphoetae]
MQSDKPSAIISLHFSGKVSGSYDFVVEEREKEVVFTVVVAFPATTALTKAFVVVGDDRILTHNTTYTIKSITTTPRSESIPILMNDTISFHIPESLYVPPEEPDDPEPDPKEPMSPEMKKLLSWLIPLTASLFVALVVVIVLTMLVVRLHRRLVNSQMKFQPMEKDMDVLKVLDQPPIVELAIDSETEDIL